QLSERPHVVAALRALGVGVERGVEAALGAAHLAQRPAEHVETDLEQVALAAVLPPVQVGAREQRVVVEHLLEVRNRPCTIDAVTREASAELVVYAPARHCMERRQRQLALAAQQQEVDRRGRRELGRAAEAAVLGVEGLMQARERRIERASGSTFTQTKFSFMSRAARGSSKDSRSITWHQWQEE